MPALSWNVFLHVLLAGWLMYAYAWHRGLNYGPCLVAAVGSMFGGGRGSQQNQNLDANGNPRAVNLSLSVDDQNNSIILSCSEAMKTDIDKLVKQLETASKDSTQVVKVIRLDGVDPLVVQQAIDAFQGHTTSRTSRNTDTGTSGLGAIPGGGFTPGGGGFTPGGSGFTPGGGGFTPGGGGFTPGGGIAIRASAPTRWTTRKCR